MRLFFPVLFLLVVLTACHKSKKYSSCCENAPLEAVFPLQPPTGDSFLTEARVYVPNIFVHNSPGFNDRFLFLTNGGVAVILSFECIDTEGNVVFFREQIQPNDAGKFWDGFTTGGGRFEGAFTYTIVLSLIDGQEKTVTGSACAYPCGDGGFPADQLPDCGFPEQNNGYGQFDPSHSAPQESCFE